MSDVRTCSRPIQSCFQCRKRKIKCNREYPCAPCILRGESEVCREVDRSIVGSGKTTAEALDDVLNRVAVLEKVVSRLSKFLPQDMMMSMTSGQRLDVASPSEVPHAMLTPPQSVGKLSPPSSGHLSLSEEGSIYGFRSPYGMSSSSDEEIVMMLEDFALGNRLNRHRAAFELVSNSRREVWPKTGLAQSLSTPLTASDPIFPFSLAEGHPLSLLVEPTTNLVQNLLGLLPEEQRARALIQFYFDRIEWYTKIFHYPSFMLDANQIFHQIPPSGQTPLPFLSTLFMVLCLALHLIEPEICQRLGIGNQEASILSKKLYSAGQACLWIDNFWSNHSLESIQSLILMGVYQQNQDDSDSHWALMGSAIKIAQNLGLSRLGSENENREYSGPWRSVIRREVGRRVWWNLIFNDWSHAAAHNGSYSIHPSQNFTGFPANINDSDLVEGRELSNHHQYTEMTFSLTRFRFVEIYRETIDNTNLQTMVGMHPNFGYGQHGRGYGFIVETDATLRGMLERIPAQFQTPPQPEGLVGIKQETMGVQEMETLLALIMGETRRMRLHRPYLERGYHDRKYAKSTEQCINSARMVLHYLKSTPEQSTIFLKWWLVMFYGFGAAVVLFIDLCHLRAENPAAVESRRIELQEALNLFKSTENASPVSQNAIALLEGMLASGETRTHTHRKRGSDHDPMQHIAKRIMVDTGLYAGQAGQSDPQDHTRRPGHRPHQHSLSQTSIPPTSPMGQEFGDPSQFQGSGDWSHLVGVPGLDQSALFGPEFDDTAIQEIGQLLWSPESVGEQVTGSFKTGTTSAPGPSASSWISHNPTSY